MAADMLYLTLRPRTSILRDMETARDHVSQRRLWLILAQLLHALNALALAAASMYFQ